MDAAEQLLIKILKDNKASITKPRRIVFRTLQKYGLVSMNRLIDLTKAHIDTASVYRTIELFEQFGIVQKIYTGWKYKLELSGAFLPHHHHAICKKCGIVIAIQENEDLEKIIQYLATKAGITNQTHSLEIRGLCKKCEKSINSLSRKNS